MIFYNSNGEALFGYTSNTLLPVDIAVSDESYRQREIMGVHAITLRIESATDITFPVGCYCLHDGVRYTLTRRATFVRRHSRNIEYTLVMYADEHRAKTCAFRHCIGVYNSNGVMTGDNGDGRLSFTLTATPREHLQMVVDNLNRGLAATETPWTIGDCIDGSEKLVSYEFSYVQDALQLITEAFETEYFFAGRAVSIGKVEYDRSAPLPLSYGAGNGLLSDSGCATDGDLPPLERVFIQGGEQNIDPSTYGSNTLLLPSNGVLWYNGENFYKDDSNVAKPSTARRYAVSLDRRSVTRYGNSEPKVDGFFDASEVYPKRIGTVSSVAVVNASDNLYDIVDNSIPATLDYSECLIAGETMTIIFQSGILSGREFDVKYYHNSVNGKAARRFEIVPTEQDGVTMPGDTFIPSVGDTYAVFHCQLPQAYFNDGDLNGAEWDAMREIVKHLYDNEEERFTLTSAEVDCIWLKNNWESVGSKLALGYHVLYSDTGLSEGLLLRITAIKDYINNPFSVQLTLTNAIVNTSLGATIKRISLRGNGEDPRTRLERERLWLRTQRGFDGRVTKDDYNVDKEELTGSLNSVIVRVNDDKTLFERLQTAINNFNNAQGDGNRIEFTTCIVVPGNNGVCKAIQEIDQILWK